MMKNWKRALSLMCTLALLLGMAMPGSMVANADEMPSEGTTGDNEITSDELVNAEEVTPTYQEVTFSDFGIKDYIVPGNAQIRKSLAGVENLDGVAFTGYLKLQKQSDMRYSFRIGGLGADNAPDNEQWRGIGMWPEATTHISFYYYKTVTGGGTTIAQLPIADYGITYDAATDTYSEFKLRMTFDFVEGTSGIKLTISLNDKLAVDTVLADGQDYLGNRLHLWTNGGKTMAVKSVDNDTKTYREVTFADFGIVDQKVPTNVQRTAALAGVENLDGIAVSGMVDIGLARDLRHALRIGSNTNWSGVGLWTEANNQLALQYFTGPTTNNGDIAKIPIADYGITYDAATNHFSPFKLRVAFDYVENTTDVKVKISVNDFVVYNGVLADAQSHFSNRVHIWGCGESISVASAYDMETPKSYYEVTFSDCGISDQLLPNGHQPRGVIPGVDNLDGVAFTGMLQMSAASNARAHSFRIGGSTASPFAGLGIRNYSTTQLSLAYFTGDVAQTELAVFDIADYGITYDETTGLYSEFKYRATFDFIDSTSDIFVTVYINDQLATKGILHNAQNVFGNNLWIWVSGTSIEVKSVEVPVNYKEVTFADFSILDQTVPSGGVQRIGKLDGADDLDGVAFTGIVEMGRVQHVNHSFRIGGKDGTVDNNWSGIGMRTEGTTKLLFGLYTGVSSYSELTTVPIADYGILFDSYSNSFSAFKLRVTFQNVGASNVRITISLNGKLAYSGIIEGGQELLGNRLHVWTQGGPITVASVTDGVVETPDEYREITFADLGLSDQLVTGQADGKLTDAANFDGVAFTGKLEMGLSANIYHSFRIGGKNGDVDNNWSGIGLRTASNSTLELYYYTAHNGGKGALATIAIADYGITYDAETNLFSEFELRTTFHYIAGTNDAYITVFVNDKLVCEGVLNDAQDYFGNQLRVWASGSTIGIKSVVDKAADDVLDVAGISVTLHEAVSMNFHIAPEEIGAMDVQVVIGSNAPVAISPTGTDAEGNYIYVVELAAAQLTDTVTLQLVKDGEAGNAYTTSGRAYAEKVLAEEAYGDCHEMVKYMLNYGAAAQIYFDYNATDLANKDYTVETVDVPNEVPTVSLTDNVDGIDFYGATLLFKSKIAVRFYFNVTGDVSDYTFLRGATMLEAKQNSGLYYVEISNINPQQLDELVEVVVSDASGNDLTVDYSPMHYIKRMYNNGNASDTLKALVKALYNYNLAAENYVGETDAKIASLVDFVVEAEEGREFRILQITDTQIIDPGQKRYAGRIEESEALTDEQLYEDCFYYIEEAVKQANPDLILLTGDIVYGEFDDNGTSLQKLVAYMESLDIPWAPIFGNHENESTKGVTWQCQQFEQAENCLFKRGELTGNSNYTIGIKQGDKLIKVIYMMDTNGCWNGQSYSYMPEFGEYNQDEKMQIHPGIGTDVIEWLDANSTQIAETLGYAPTKFAAFHIPIQEFTAAAIAKGYQTGDATSFTINDPTGEDFGRQNSKINDGIPTSNLWSIMKRQNFDGVFVGHYHTNNTSIVFEGIRLTFGLKTSEYDNYLEDMLGGTLITVAEGGASFDVEHCYVEPME